MIIIIGPKFFGYCEAIVQCLRLKGVESEYIDELPYNNFLFKSLIRLFPSVAAILTKSYHTNILKRINADQKVSKIIYISTESIDENFVTDVRDNIKQVAYAWDSISNKMPFKVILDRVDVAASFDPKDCEKYGYIYIPLFAEDSFNDKRNDRIYLFTLIGSAHTKRADIAQKVSKLQHAKSFVYLYSPNILVFVYRNNLRSFKSFKTFKTKPMSKHDVAKIFNSSKFVLDFAHPGQSGLTSRTFEAIRAGAILVTNNKTELPFSEMNKFVIQVDTWDVDLFERLEQLQYEADDISDQLDYNLSIRRFCDQILEV